MKRRKSLIIYVKRPKECSDSELENFSALVKKGGQVSERGLGALIKKAHLLGFGYCEKVLVAIAAIKVPRQTYKERVFQKASSEENTGNYVFELGWCYTEPQYRGQGICQRLIEQLLRQQKEYRKSIFATTVSEAMKIILNKYGFIELGQPYESSNAKRMLTLHVLKK